MMMESARFMNRAVLGTLVLLAVALAHPPSAGARDAPRDGVFIHLSSGPENPHRVLMALQMAKTMSDTGRAVLLYCDIDAVHMLLADAPELRMEPFEKASKLLADLIAAGVAVRACPSCLEAAGHTAESLREGVGLADADEFFSFAGGRILTLDY